MIDRCSIDRVLNLDCSHELLILADELLAHGRLIVLTVKAEPFGAQVQSWAVSPLHFRVLFSLVIYLALIGCD